MKRLKKIKHKKFIIIGLLIILLQLETYTFAKYVIEKVSSYFISSKNFYFNSNILKENNPTYEINNWSGIGTFNITIDLSSKKNNYIATDYDISYEIGVTCPDDVICSIDKTSSIIYASTNTDEVVVTASPTRLYTEGESIDIKIEAESKSPYVKKISSTYRYIVGKSGVTYEVDDIENRTYLLFKVTNAINYCTVTEAFDTYSVGDIIDSSDYLRISDTNKQKCISKKATLEFDPNYLLLDTVGDILNKSTYSNTQISGTNYINKLEYAIGPLSTVEVKFYKKDEQHKYTYEELSSSNILKVNITDPE